MVEHDFQKLLQNRGFIRMEENYKLLIITNYVDSIEFKSTLLKEIKTFKNRQKKTKVFSQS